MMKGRGKEEGEGEEEKKEDITWLTIT